MQLNSQKPKITVIITSFNDHRIIELLKKLMRYDIDQVIIADGGSSKTLLDEIKEFEKSNPTVQLIIAPGSITESRDQVRSSITGDITVFIDTDEVPAEGWLDAICQPIMKGSADFCFGPTIPMKPTENRVERFVNEYDRVFYEKIVSADPLMGPMGNSSWKTEILRKVNFDTTLTMGGEDYDFNLKAKNLGYNGKYVHEAILYHDQSSISRLSRLLKKRFRYMVGAAIAYRRNSSLTSRLMESSGPKLLTSDPIELLLVLMKPIAFIFSLIIGSGLPRSKQKPAS